MSLSNDTLSILLDIKSQMKRWRLLTILLVVAGVVWFTFDGTQRVEDFSDSFLDLKESCIGEIDVSGVILKDNYRDKVLKEIKKDDKVRALIVNIDSPGGGVVESEILYSLLRDIAKEKPMVVVMNGIGASGGYMASIASDYIIAKNGSITGSIGVLLQSMEVTELAEKLGIKFQTYKSSPLKGSPSPFEKENPLVDKVVQESIDDIYDFFVELVAERRKMDLKRAYQVSNGQVYTGRQALKLNLIDKIGGEQEALAYLKTKGVDVEELEIEEIDIVEPISDFEIIDRILGVFFKPSKSILPKKHTLLLM